MAAIQWVVRWLGLKKDAPCSRTKPAGRGPDAAGSGQHDALDPARLVFIDEPAAKTNLTRRHGRAPKGERLVCHAPHGHWHTTTMISSVRLDGTTDCMTIEGATDTDVFQACVREVLVPVLRKGDIVILDYHRHGTTTLAPASGVLEVSSNDAEFPDGKALCLILDNDGTHGHVRL